MSEKRTTLDLETIPKQIGCRWFLRLGMDMKNTITDRGFKTKKEATQWIESHNYEWRKGYMFKLYNNKPMYIVSRNGKEATV